MPLTPPFTGRRYKSVTFFTLDAAAHTMDLSLGATEDLLRRGLLPLLRDDRLVYCLLRQIERY